MVEGKGSFDELTKEEQLEAIMFSLQMAAARVGQAAQCESCVDYQRGIITPGMEASDLSTVSGQVTEAALDFLEGYLGKFYSVQRVKPEGSIAGVETNLEVVRELFRRMLGVNVEELSDGALRLSWDVVYTEDLSLEEIVSGRYKVFEFDQDYVSALVAFVIERYGVSLNLDFPRDGALVDISPVAEQIDEIVRGLRIGDYVDDL